MRCPRCETDLRAANPTADIHLCGACHGTALQQQSLVGVLEAMAAELAELEPDVPIEPVADRGGGIACPACGCIMENEGYLGTRVAFFDRCSSCGLLWFDDRELQAMARLLARTDARIEERRQASRERYEELSRVVDAILQARAKADLLLLTK